MTTAIDVSDLGRLQRDNGPFLSAYVPADAPQQWTTLRAELAEQGAPEAALALVDPLMTGEAQETVAVIANEHEVFVNEHLVEPMVYGRGSWSMAPDLLPIIKDRQERGAELIEDDETRRDLKTEVATETVDLLEQFKGDTANTVEGIRATAEALHRAAVDVLLVRDDRDERRDVPREDAEAIDMLVRDAIVTGASVRVIPASGPVREGVGALLR